MAPDIKVFVLSVIQSFNLVDNYNSFDIFHE